MLQKTGTVVLLVCMVFMIRTAAVQAKASIDVWIKTMFTDAMNNWVRNKIENWAEENDVDVKISFAPQRQYNTKIIAAIESGNVPDVVINGWPVAKSAQKGLLLPLDDVIAKLDEDDIFSSKLAQQRIQGHYYGVSMFFEPYLAHIRKDVLEDYGLSIPKTYTELGRVARIVTDQPNDFYGLGHVLGQSLDGNVQFLALFYSFNGGYLSERSAEGVSVFKENPTYEALNWIKMLYEDGAIPPDATGWTNATNNQAYIQGRTAITLNPPSILYQLIKQESDLADKTVLVGVGVTADAGEESAFVFKRTKYPELAKDLVYNIFKDKEDYRKGLIESSQLNVLPIFKSQADIISHQWRKGQWPHWAVDPLEVIKKSRQCNPTAYPLGEASSVSDEAMMSYLWSSIVSWVVVDKMSVDEAVEKGYDELLNMVEETYGSRSR